MIQALVAAPWSLRDGVPYQCDAWDPLKVAVRLVTSSDSYLQFDAMTTKGAQCAVHVPATAARREQGTQGSQSSRDALPIA